LTLFGSLKMAAASALQKSTSSPAQRVGQSETREGAVRAAVQVATLLDGVERLRRCRRRNEAEKRCECDAENYALHDKNLPQTYGRRRPISHAGPRPTSPRKAI
jgi:uncharacterized protein YecT (DUF1311 family)